jgi:hypothetical protein
MNNEYACGRIAISPGFRLQAQLWRRARHSGGRQKLPAG